MKKILAILLSALLLLSASGALAESSFLLADFDGRFDIILTHEEPWLIMPQEAPASYTYCTVSREGLAPVFISIAPSELADGLSMGDLGEEGQQMLRAMAAVQFEDPTTEICSTPSGNLYISICSNEDWEIDTLFTLYKGYFVELTQEGMDNGLLTEEDHDFMLEVLYGIHFDSEEE